MKMFTETAAFGAQQTRRDHNDVKWRDDVVEYLVTINWQRVSLKRNSCRLTYPLTTAAGFCYTT